MKNLLFRAFVLSICFFCNNIFLNAQINLQFNAINEYLFSTKAVLNMTVINTNPKSFEVYFKGKINSGDGNMVAEFRSENTLVNPGANVFNPMTLGLKEVMFHNNDILEIETRTGTYPSGNYTICIWSVCVSQDCNGAGQNAGAIETPACIQIHIENPTPLLLASPGNEAEIEETRPLYTWIPPAPVAGSASLNYKMILVEIYESQNKADALNINRPLIELEGIPNPMLMHPSDLPELEKGKWYAWQVEAFVGKTLIGKSEQWKFKVKKEPIIKDSIMYAVVSRNMDAGAYRISDDGYLYFIMNVNRPNYSLKYEILKSDQSLVKAGVKQIVFDDVESKEISTNDLIVTGQGKFKIQISELNLESGYYFLHIVSPEKENFYLKFLIE